MILCEKYKIGADKNNIILFEKKMKKVKDSDVEDEVFTAIGWYPSLKILLKNLPEEIVKDNIDDIFAISEKIENLRTEILNIDYSELKETLRADVLKEEIVAELGITAEEEEDEVNTEKLA